MVRLSFLLILLSFEVLAIDAIVKVLEAPIFKEPREESKILKHVRKGEKIRLHPSANRNKRYDYLKPEQKTDSELIEAHAAQYNEKYPDKLLNENVYTFEDGDRFLKTYDGRMRPGYILKKHVYVLYEDIRELSEEKLKYDPTDYRIAEPLPDNYPLSNPTGYKGSFRLLTGATSRSSYPYPGDKIKDKTKLHSTVHIVWTRKVELDKQGRLFFGGLFSYNQTRKQIYFSDHQADENWQTVGLGPYLSYDIWKSKEWYWTGYLAFTYNFRNQLDVLQRDGTTEDRAQFTSPGFSAKSGLYLKSRNFFTKHVDFLLGFDINLEPPRELSGHIDRTNSSWWTEEQRFTSKFLTEISLILGIQSEY